MARGAHSPVRHQVSEQEAELSRQKQQPHRHRLRAPRGRRNQTSPYKSRVWQHVIDLRLQDPPEDRFRDIQRTLPTFKIDENQNEVRPPAAGIHSHHRDVYFIPPPRAGGGAVGASTPVSTVPLGFIHQVDPLLATQLREDPASLAVRDTRLRVLSTMRLVRTGLVGQLAALQQWVSVNLHYNFASLHLAPSLFVYT